MTYTIGSTPLIKYFLQTTTDKDVKLRINTSSSLVRARITTKYMSSVPLLLEAVTPLQILTR